MRSRITAEHRLPAAPSIRTGTFATVARAVAAARLRVRAAPRRCSEVIAVQAKVGDEMVVETDTVGRVRRRGEILEGLVTGGDHYRVRWDDGHESLFFPGPDARVVQLTRID